MKRSSIALFLSGIMMLVTLMGCSGGPEPRQSYGGGYGGASPAPQRQPERQGMSTKQKLVLLTAAAAAAYFYNKHQQKKQQAGANHVQYYRSKNGRIYYRDAQKRVHWVTPPRQVYVPANEADRYRRQANDFAYYR